MFNTNNMTNKIMINCRILFAAFVILCGLGIVNAQTPSPSPTPDDVQIGSFKVVSSIEFGVRGKSLTGSDNKFRSDQNYRSGVRIFSSSISLEDKEGRNRFFDSLLINSSGWGADPSGFTRVNLEKTGGYRFTSNVRRITYFNNLNNHALGQHTQNTRNNMGDFDLTVFPASEKLRLNFGYSYSKYTGPGVSNARNYRDDFAVPVDNRATSNDVRAGIAWQLAGVNLSFTQGYRRFIDRTSYRLDAPTIGNNRTDTTIYNFFSRQMPVNGEAFYSVFDANKTFAKKLDLTARIVYTSTQNNSSVNDIYNGRDNSNNFVDLDAYDIYAKSKRPQTKGDFGISYRATDKFTISNTFSVDKFSVNGGEDFFQSFALRNPAGVTQPTRITRSTAYRVNDFKRVTNLIEGDVQFTNRVSGHIGYRFTRRNVSVTGYDLTIVSSNAVSTVNNPSRFCPFTGVGTANPLIFCENEENSTHTLIAGMKIKPTNHWVLFWDVERGTADNVFTRVENYKFTNFRIRNRFSFNKFALSLSGISKDNTNPAQTDAVPPVGFGARVKSRIFSGTADWNPIPGLSFNTGYTYTHQTSKTPIYIIAPSPTRVLGRSEYYVRDHFGFLDVIASPNKWVSLYASYRISKDNGQGSRPLTDPYAILIGNSTTALLTPQDIISSYPMQLQSPEVRASFRLSDNINWNIGYQYFGYRERYQRVQDYRAHLPYTSITIFFGGADR